MQEIMKQSEEEDEKIEDLEAKKHEDEPGHDQGDAHHDRQPGEGHQHCDKKDL